MGELERAQLTGGDPGEDVELAATRQVLASAERVQRLCEESYGALYESDGAVLGALGGVWRRVGDLAALDPRFLPYLDARDGIKSQLEDLALFLRRYADGIDSSPARLQQIEERLALLERLKRKYGPALADVVARRDALRRERDDLERGERSAGRAGAAARGRADGLPGGGRARFGRARRAAATGLARALERLLADLAMDRTRFDVRFGAGLSEMAWTARGIDQAEFFVSPNPGEELRPLARIVSGGELSRIMLAMKTLTATSRRGFSDDPDRPASPAAPG